MKKTIITCLLPFIGLAQAQMPELRVETPIKAVTLYLDGAEINQQKQVSLNQGITQVVFTNLSPKLIPKSIQVNVSDGVDVLSISDKLNFLTVGNENPKIKRLKDSLKLMEYLRLQLVSDRDAYEKEKELLQKNNSIGGQDKGVLVSELKLAADFYRVRMKEVNGELLRLGTKIDDYNVVIDRQDKELQELNANDNRPSGEINILLQAEQKTTVSIDLKYVISDAGWAPYYDLKAEDINKPIVLVYRARAFNNSGVDWTNVKLKLSTSDPTRNASKPFVNPWYLNFSNNQSAYINNNNDAYTNNRMQQSTNAVAENLENKYSDKEEEKLDKLSLDRKGKKYEAKKITYEEVQVSELSAEFEIKKNYSIPSDAKPYIVEVTTYSLNASFKHYSVPKVERDAFLLARIIGWEDLDLIEGPANVYFGGSFVGQSYINPNSVNDTLDLSFGRDNKVVVTRTKIKDFDKEKVSGNNRKMVYSYEIMIKNNRKNAVTIDVEDQLPVSQNSEIIVEAIELSKGLENKDDGKVSWKFLIPPGETQKITFTFSIKYPRNRSFNPVNKQKRLRATF